MVEEEGSPIVTFERFFPLAARVISSTAHERDNEEKIYRAFLVIASLTLQALDTERKGYLEPDDLRDMMTSMGEQFSKEEIDEMLLVCFF